MTFMTEKYTGHLTQLIIDFFWQNTERKSGNRVDLFFFSFVFGLFDVLFSFCFVFESLVNVQGEIYSTFSAAIVRYIFLTIMHRLNRIAAGKW